MNFEEYLLNKKILNKDDISSIRLNISNEINKALEIAFDEDAVKSNNCFELDSVYKNHEFSHVKPSEEFSKLDLLMSLKLSNIL